MSKDYLNFKRVEQLSEGDAEVPLYQKIIKLGEESGEIDQAFLRYVGALNVSKSAEADDEETLGLKLLEECCDVMNVTMDIINFLGFSDEDVKKMFEKKLAKWQAKQDNRT